MFQSSQKRDGQECLCSLPYGLCNSAKSPSLGGRGFGGGGANKKMAPKLTQFAKQLRKNSTKAEALLWSRLRNRQMGGIKFRRQQPIGNFIVDFVSFEKRLVIEIDGGQHTSNKHKDHERDRFLKDSSFKVLRFWNTEVFDNLDGVLEVIRRKCL
jgi:very-short-patch-repair endonuclease